MELFRLHAYAVFPTRRSENPSVPEGGPVTITAALNAILDESEIAARFDNRTLVDFEMPDGDSRVNEVRDLIVAFGFRDGVAVKQAALGIAARLGNAMDMRSGECLLVLTAMRENTRRRVTLWTFPRDQAFRFRRRGAGATIQVLTDVFSQTSKLRKAAQFEGREVRNDFLQGRVLDFQANQLAHDVANFWISRFLQCTLSIADDAGTRMLATAIRKTVDASVKLEEKEQLLTAVMAIRTSPRRRWSLNEFAQQYLHGPVKDRFLEAAPNPESAASLFNFRRTDFEAALAYRVYTLQTGVLVSAPLAEIGNSVKVTESREAATVAARRQLSCTGAVVDEKVRAHRG